MRKLFLTRQAFREDGIFSVLSGENFLLHAGEHSYDGKPKLPNGTYLCERGMHLLHSGPINTFEIMNVPGHSGILFHRGNYPQKDSDGCVVLGMQTTVSPSGFWMVASSADAFSRFQDYLDGQDQFELVVA